jgi:hypothetical protein
VRVVRVAMVRLNLIMSFALTTLNCTMALVMCLMKRMGVFVVFVVDHLLVTVVMKYYLQIIKKEKETEVDQTDTRGCVLREVNMNLQVKA